jgi:hypothetical protein
MTEAAEIKVIALGGFKAAYLELVPGFERASEHKVDFWRMTLQSVLRERRGCVGRIRRFRRNPPPTVFFPADYAKTCSPNSPEKGATSPAQSSGKIPARTSR